MAGELVELPRFSAYLKYAHEENGKQVVRKEKIQTKPYPKFKTGMPTNGQTCKGVFMGHSVVRLRRRLQCGGKTGNQKP